MTRTIATTLTAMARQGPDSLMATYSQNGRFLDQGPSWIIFVSTDGFSFVAGAEEKFFGTFSLRYFRPETMIFWKNFREDQSP